MNNHWALCVATELEQASGRNNDNAGYSSSLTSSKAIRSSSVHVKGILVEVILFGDAQMSE